MSELTDRMRTCAAYILAVQASPDDGVAALAKMLQPEVLRDAADLLIEASNVMEEAKPPLGEPWESIPPPPKNFAIDRTPQAHWNVDSKMPSQPRACPKCGTHAANIARRKGRKLMLACPVCGEQWEYKPQGVWI